MAVTTLTVDLGTPGETAELLAAANARQAAAAGVAPDAASLVHAIAMASDRTDPGRWDLVDPYLTLLFHRGLVGALEAVASGDRDALRVALERMRHALAEVEVGEPAADARPIREVLRWLADTIGVAHHELAVVLGVPLRTLQRWLSPTGSAGPHGEDARRVRVVARVVTQLRHVLTGVGAVRWLEWERDDLDGRRPLDLLAEPAELPRLMRAVAATRTSDAT